MRSVLIIQVCRIITSPSLIKALLYAGCSTVGNFDISHLNFNTCTP
jgi:hypothetical protein